MIYQSESMVSSQECIEHNAKLPPTAMILKVRQKIQMEKRHKIPMTWLKTRILEAYQMRILYY